MTANDHPLSVGLPGAAPVATTPRTAMRIAQMDCPAEATLVREKLEAMACVQSLEFNLLQRILKIQHSAGALPQIINAVHELGFTVQLADASGRLPDDIQEAPGPWWPLALAAVAALASEILAWTWPTPWVTAGLALVAVALSGMGTYKRGFIALLHGNLNINALMSIAVTGALILGQWPEAAMVMVLFAIAELIEARSLDHARHAIAGLMQSAPETVTVRQGDGSWLTLRADEVTPGARVRIRPGERFGLDGVVLSGRSQVDEAAITGESLPVEKSSGDAVYAGSMNGMGALEYKVRASWSESMLARIVRSVQDAQASKAPIQRFIDRFARVYTPIVCLIALLVAIVPPLALQEPWLHWIYKALVLLVIACPCALVISTPVAIVSGLSAAARHGILVKGGQYLECGRKLLWLAFDKTGTITHGKPVLTDFEAIGSTDMAHASRLGASLASRSHHPVSQAIAASCPAGALESVENFEAIPGGGVRGIIGGGVYVLGNHGLMEDSGHCTETLAARIDHLERQGKTVVMLMGEGRVLALWAVADTIKPTSGKAIADLHALGVRTVMLSGDNNHTAEAIAAEVGIDAVLARQLPDDKLRAIKRYAQEGLVGMVGDGINDAPALAQADIGFAMGVRGSDTAIETADIALMDDDLCKIPRFVRLSRSTYSVLVQNIALALGIKAVFLALAILGPVTMWMAVFADVGASLLVVGNSLRLLKK